MAPVQFGDGRGNELRDSVEVEIAMYFGTIVAAWLLKSLQFLKLMSVSFVTMSHSRVPMDTDT